jgi:predicted metal-dependent hydrolase
MSDITVRRMRFVYPKDLDTVFIEGEPEDSYNQIALSLLMPYLEPYLIRTMRAARKHVTDPKLADDLDKFCAQEGQHYRQHREFNELFRDRGFDRLPEFEREIEDDYQRFSKTKSLRFNLAYAEGFEAFTTQMAHVFAGQDTSKWHPAALDLFQWHMVEELEHRCVAFDVYEHVVGNYPYRCVWGAFAQQHFLKWIVRVAKYMSRADTVTFEKYGGKAAHKKRSKRLWGIFFRQVIPRAAKTYSPWYTPHNVSVPDQMKDLADHYTAVVNDAPIIPA